MSSCSYCLSWLGCPSRICSITYHFCWLHPHSRHQFEALVCWALADTLQDIAKVRVGMACRRIRVDVCWVPIFHFFLSRCPIHLIPVAANPKTRTPARLQARSFSEKVLDGIASWITSSSVTSSAAAVRLAVGSSRRPCVARDEKPSTIKKDSRPAPTK